MGSPFVTPMFRMSYPHLYEVDQFGKYSCLMLFPDGTDLSRLKADLLADAKEVDAQNPKKVLAKQKYIRTPAEDNTVLEGYIGVRVSTTQPPVVVGRDGKPLGKGSLYPGCWCRADINTYKHSYKGGGVTIGLNGVQKVKDDEDISGRRQVAFDALDPEEDSADNPANYEAEEFDDIAF